jgi:putative aldouronate transport system permease protein
MLINRFGYSVLPRGFDITAYAYIFKNPSVLLDAYMVTILSAVAGTLLSVTVNVVGGIPLSRDYLKHKKVITYYIFFTMLFSGGLVPSYILITHSI